MAAFQSAILLLGVALGIGLSYVQSSDPETALKSVTWWGSVDLWSPVELSAQAASVLIGVTLALMMLGGVYWLNRMGWAWFSEIETLLDRALVPSLRRCRIWQLLVLAILAGVGEELLFRWAVQGWLEFFGNRVIAALFLSEDLSSNSSRSLAFGLAAVSTSVLFGLCHAVTRAYWVLASGMGLIFSLVVVGGGGLVGAMIAHGLYDFLAFLWLCQRTREKRGAGADNEFTVG